LTSRVAADCVSGSAFFLSGCVAASRHVATGLSEGY
jgi:hypothetical protein